MSGDNEAVFGPLLEVKRLEDSYLAVLGNVKSATFCHRHFEEQLLNKVRDAVVY